MMIVGLLKEIKVHEYRVGLTPDCVADYVSHGHRVLVEASAGIGAGFGDDAYAAQGAEIFESRQKLFDEAEMIIKVKEPLPGEYDFFRPGQILYTYLHLAADAPQANALMEKNVKAVAYETITDASGHLPCLTPMSEIAGRLAAQEGAKYLEKPFGGRGVLLGGVPGVKRGKVTIIGGGIVGINACKIAVGMGAEVTILDISAQRLAYLDDIFGSKISTLYSTRSNIVSSIQEADMVIGAVLIPGAAAPKLISRKDLALMKEGSVIVDVAIDQGGCFETSKATYHDNPTYIVDGIVHYCVANMPGAVSLTSTMALTSNTLKYGLEIADKGLENACLENRHIMDGLNIYEGKCTNEAVAHSLGVSYWKPNF